MRSWIDNTGLHAAGLSLRGLARGKVDADGLLQLATLLVFSDRLFVCGFESEPVAKTSSHIRDELIGIGVPEGVLQVRHDTEFSYAEACRDAAEYAADEINYLFAPRADIEGVVLVPSDIHFPSRAY